MLTVQGKYQCEHSQKQLIQHGAEMVHYNYTKEVYVLVTQDTKKLQAIPVKYYV